METKDASIEIRDRVNMAALQSNNSFQTFFDQNMGNLDQKVKTRSSTMINLFGNKNMSNSIASKIHTKAKESLKDEDHWIDEEADSADNIDYNESTHPNQDDEDMEDDLQLKQEEFANEFQFMTKGDMYKGNF